MKVGMIVKVLEDEFFPTDMIVLKSSDPKGGLFVETKNLDGETNLKAKSVHRLMLEKFSSGGGSNPDSLFNNLKGNIVCEQPNNAIYKFEGNIGLDAGNKIPMSADNFLLRGCKLRNTQYIYGLVVFTGPETKIMKNSASAKYKFSTLEKLTN
jgi:magnesium-transporting ATPase (P-type)